MNQIEEQDTNGAEIRQVDVAFICALHSPELDQLLRTGPTWTEEPRYGNDPQTYHLTTLTTPSGKTIDAVAAAPTAMGLVSAAVLATKMILKFDPRLVVMVGIAAGVNESSQGFGDIIAADQTFDYGSGKLSEAGDTLTFAPDPRPIPIQTQLLARLKEWQRDERQLDGVARAWRARQPNTRLRLHIGPLASGAAVFNAKEPVEDIRKHWRKLIGRVLYAITDLVSSLIANSMGAVSWSTVMWTLLRGQLLVEYASPYMVQNNLQARSMESLIKCISAISNGDPEWFGLALEEFSSLTERRLRNYDDLTELGAPIPDAAVHIQLGDPGSIWITSPDFSRPLS